MRFAPTTCLCHSDSHADRDGVLDEAVRAVYLNVSKRGALSQRPFVRADVVHEGGKLFETAGRDRKPLQ